MNHQRPSLLCNLFSLNSCLTHRSLWHLSDLNWIKVLLPKNHILWNNSSHIKYQSNQMMVLLLRMSLLMLSRLMYSNFASKAKAYFLLELQVCLYPSNFLSCNTHIAKWNVGTRKSLLLRAVIRALCHKYSKQPGSVAITASTGMAASTVGGW